MKEEKKMTVRAREFYEIIAPRDAKPSLAGGRIEEAWAAFACAAIFALVGLAGTAYFARTAVSVAQHGPHELGATLLMDLLPPALILAALWVLALVCLVCTLFGAVLALAVALSGELKARNTDQ